MALDQPPSFHHDHRDSVLAKQREKQREKRHRQKQKQQKQCFSLLQGKNEQTSKEKERAFKGMHRTKVNTQSVEYFKNIGIKIDELEHSHQEQTLVFERALEELVQQTNQSENEQNHNEQGKETYEMIIHPIVSRIVEKIVQKGNMEHVTKITTMCAQWADQIVEDKNASHIVEAIIERAIKIIQYESEKNTQTPFTQIFDEVIKTWGKKGWITFFQDKYAGFIMRALLNGLQGKGGANETKNQPAKRAKQTNDMHRREGVQRNPNNAFAQRYAHVLHDVMHIIAELTDSDIADCCYHLTASPVLQTLIETSYAMNMRSEVRALAARIFAWNRNSAPMKADEEEAIHQSNTDYVDPIVNNHELPDTRNMNALDSTEQIRQMMCDRVASHVVDSLISLGDNCISNRFVMQLADYLGELVMDPCAGHCVQHLIKHSTSLRDYETIYDCLQPYFREMVQAGRTAVLETLLSKASQLKHRPSTTLNSIIEAIGCKDEEIITALVEASIKTGSKTTFNHCGCTLAASMFRLFPTKNRSKTDEASLRRLSKSLLALNHDTIVALAKDNTASRLLESFVAVAVPKDVCLLIKRLEMDIVGLALDRNGSFVIEKLFDAADIEQKAVIARCLVQQESRLAGVSSGKWILKNLGINLFKRNPQQWQTRQVSKPKPSNVTMNEIDRAPLNYDDQHLQFSSPASSSNGFTISEMPKNLKRKSVIDDIFAQVQPIKADKR